MREDVERPDVEPEVIALAATDPANVYGAAVAWPAPTEGGKGRARRVAGAHVVLVDGHLVLFLDKGGRTVLTFTDDRARLDAAAAAAAGLVEAERVRDLRITKVDGEVPAHQPLITSLREAGFTDHPKGLVRR